MDKLQINNEELFRRVGERIRALRLKSGYSSYESFAIENDLDRKQYWRAEKGSNLTLKTLHTITKIHNISMEEFFQNL